jgi:hypothetical protein
LVEIAVGNPTPVDIDDGPPRFHRRVNVANVLVQPDWMGRSTDGGKGCVLPVDIVDRVTQGIARTDV